MAEARREVIREDLRRAKFICLAMDDRQYQKIIRFRCDAPKKPFVRRGVLGVMSLANSSTQDFEEDHALIAVRKLDAFLNRFCTPLKSAVGDTQASNSAVDDSQALKEHIRKHIRVFAADGASKERRALFTAVREMFENVVLLLRDGAHALRIAIRDPLHYDNFFGEIWNELFDQRHALVPDVMHSNKWQDLLQNIQREVFRIPCESRPLAVVLKHLSFAKIRFDSSADPCAKVAFMLLPLAVMLAFIGSDERSKTQVRERAKKLLKRLDSKFALGIGVSADWGLVTQAFLRLFDKVYHDVAKTERHINAFVEVLKELFQNGGVFLNREFDKNLRVSRLPAIGGYFGAVGVKPMFVTEHIEKMLGRRVVFNCGSEQILLWRPLPKEDAEDISARLKFVTSHVIDRIDAEMGHLKAFSCFDVETVREAFACPDEEAGKKQRHLERKLYRLAQDIGGRSKLCCI